MMIYINPTTDRIKVTSTEEFTVEREIETLFTDFELENFFVYRIRDNKEEFTVFMHMDEWEKLKLKLEVNNLTVELLQTEYQLITGEVL